MKRFSLILAAVLCAALCGCTNDAEKATQAVTDVMQSYVIVEEGEEGDKAPEEELPAPVYGDDATMQRLAEYGVDAAEYHKHCFARYSFEVGDAEVAEDGKSAQVSVTITNVDLAAASDAAASDYATYNESEDAAAAYNENGRPPLFDKLVEFLYSHLDNDALVSTTVTLAATKDDEGNWSFDPTNNAEFFSALYGQPGATVE